MEPADQSSPGPPHSAMLHPTLLPEGPPAVSLPGAPEAITIGCLCPTLIHPPDTPADQRLIAPDCDVHRDESSPVAPPLSPVDADLLDPTGG